jgi:hypothetical protein
VWKAARLSSSKTTEDQYRLGLATSLALSTARLRVTDDADLSAYIDISKNLCASSFVVKRLGHDFLLIRGIEELVAVPPDITVVVTGSTAAGPCLPSSCQGEEKLAALARR